MLLKHLNEEISKLIPYGEKFAIAFSGGGDSTALVHALKDHPQSEFVYIVDHNLRSGSHAEAQSAKYFAESFGYNVEVLKWKHGSVKTGVQEKARIARYGLMGNKCREEGIKYLLTAHNFEDNVETLMMRYDRKTDWRGAAGMSSITYAPVWPELSLVSIVRPLLSVSRKLLRDYNISNNIIWSEDPSNKDIKYGRIKARNYLRERPDIVELLLQTSKDMRECIVKENKILLDQFRKIGTIDQFGNIYLTGIPYPELMFHCLRATSGQGRMIDRTKIRNLLERMKIGDFQASTLAGSMVLKFNQSYVIGRDPSAVKGRKDSRHKRKNYSSELEMTSDGQPQVWDGRFVFGAAGKEMKIAALHDNLDLLSKEQFKLIKNIPFNLRISLPVVKDNFNAEIKLGVNNLVPGIQPLVKKRLEYCLGGSLDKTI